MGRVVVIGDVGGHPDQLRRALARVGALGEAPELPDDVVVIQVGDLVDRGPDSLGVLSLVSGVLERQPEQWVQLLGNHEWQYLPEGLRFNGDMPEAGVPVLTDWWDHGVMTVAAAVVTGDGEEWLLSHAGLTLDTWRRLGEPLTASSAAWLLNDHPELLREGFLSGRTIGPLWADAGWELCDPWLDYHATGGMVPFGQIHGHSAMVDYADRSWRAPGRVRQRATADWTARQVRVRIGGRLFIGVDPKHGKQGAPAWDPLVLRDATVLTRERV